MTTEHRSSGTLNESSVVTRKTVGLNLRMYMLLCSLVGNTARFLCKQIVTNLFCGDQRTLRGRYASGHKHKTVIQGTRTSNGGNSRRKSLGSGEKIRTRGKNRNFCLVLSTVALDLYVQLSVIRKDNVRPVELVSGISVDFGTDEP
jgi:hypothetical protein